MKNITAILLILATGLLTFPACKKNHSSSVPVSTEITGKWKLVKYGIDINGNGKMDSYEVVTDTSSVIVWAFNMDSTCTISNALGVVSSFNWALKFNNTYVKTTYPMGLNGWYHIDNISSSSLTLRDTSGGGIVWDILSKQ